MKLTDIINGKMPSLSFEVFPPKTWDAFHSVMQTTEKIAELKPSYMSVTYRSSRATSEYTIGVARSMLNLGVTPLAHLTCISSTRGGIREELEMMKDYGIENILALRGDIPEGMSRDRLDYRYASELIADVREFGGFTVGGACYPEGHPESSSHDADIEALRIKCEAGCEFLTTQMFFDNATLLRFMYKVQRAGIDVPVVPGIMPVTSAKQISRILSISGNALPAKFMRLVDRYGDKPEAMKQAGIAYATEQIIDLYASGFNAVHVYSMNKPDVARAIHDNLSEIIK